MNTQQHIIAKGSILWFTQMLVVLFALLIQKTIVAQQYFIKSYAVESGLPTRIITDACQDKEGYMWFSTYLGISKYDGFSFTNYDTLNGLPDQHYRKLRCDENGIIWAVPYAFTGYIVFFKDNTWNTVIIPIDKFPYSYITSFDVTYRNNSPVLCIGTCKGIEEYQNNKWTHLDISNDKSTNKIYSVTKKNDAFYIGTPIGLCILKDGTPDWSLNKKINTQNEAILAVTFEKPGFPWERMWILTPSAVGYFQNNRLTRIAVSFLLEDIEIAIFPFIGIRRGGDVIFGNNFSKYKFNISNSKIKPLGVKTGFSSNGASSLFIDREENIWLTDSRGIDKISDITLVNYFESSGMPENEVTAIAETNDGRYVLGHNQQISILQDNKFKVIEFPGHQNHLTRVLDIMKDRDGNIWFSGNNLGIGKLIKNNGIQWYFIEKGQLASSVSQDISGRIWIGTNRKLFYLAGEKIIEYQHNNLLTGGVRKIFPSDEGGIYITNMNGLWHVDKDSVKKIQVAEENQQLNAFSYFKDKKGTEFVGTMNGLYFIKNDIITRFTQNGLKINNPIYFILQDHKNNYWLGTNNGILKWDGFGIPEVYNPLNGLSGFETNRAAGLVDSEGKVWVGTDRGLSCFTPDAEKLKTPVPAVILLSFETVHGNTYPLTENISIKNTDNSISFNFRGISYINEELLTYKYKLEGYDKEWREATQAMLDKIKYVNLKPGKYRLCVSAKNYSSAWSKTVYSQEIVIKPPWYLTWWFILIAVLAFILLFWIFHSIASQKLINRTLKKEISERKLAEKNLKESEKRLSFIIEGSRLGTWDWDISTNSIHRNHLCCEMLGYSLEEMEQTPQFWLNLIHPEDKKRTQIALQLHLDGRTPLLEAEYRILTKDKQYKWIQDRAKVVQRDAVGKPIRMSGTYTDITDRKRAVDALQKSEEHIRLLMASIPVAIYIVPVDPDIDLEMITGNVKALTGFTAEEFLSKPDFWRNRLHPDDKEMVLEAFKHSQEHGGITIEYRWMLADGTYKWFHEQAIIKTNGTKHEYLGVFVDINDRKLAEQEIQDKNHQLNLINAEKDKLFSIISHDLRSPVNGFLSLTALLSSDLETMTHNQIKEIGSSLFSSAIKINDLLNDLLEWSLLQRGLTVFIPLTLNLKQIADDCINSIEEQSKDKNIEVVNEIEDAMQVATDAHMLQAVMRNLLTNALKFTHKGGIVKVSAITKNDGFAHVSISDTGIGINAELLSKLFKVNEKTGRKGTEGEPSSGLGLILCKEFVEKQNGTLWAESEIDKGSTFHFTVPVPD